jgi:HAD superfamily hydrolase (TIGR01509 family)
MPLDVSLVRAVCFDVDGTLRDTDDQWVERLAQLLRPMAVFLGRRDAQKYARKLVMSMEDPGNLAYHLADRLGIDNLAAKILRPWGKRRSRSSHKIHPMIPGVQEALSKLHRRYPLAIVSARDESETCAFLDAHQLTPLFQIIVAGQTCRHTKPYPDPVLWAAQQMNLPPSACLMVGDTTVDIRAGKTAGAQTVGVLCGFGEEAELRRAGADLILNSTSELLDYLNLT